MEEQKALAGHSSAAGLSEADLQSKVPILHASACAAAAYHAALFRADAEVASTMLGSSQNTLAATLDFQQYLVAVRALGFASTAAAPSQLQNSHRAAEEGKRSRSRSPSFQPNERDVAEMEADEEEFWAGYASETTSPSQGRLGGGAKEHMGDTMPHGVDLPLASEPLAQYRGIAGSAVPDDETENQSADVDVVAGTSAPDGRPRLSEGIAAQSRLETPAGGAEGPGDQEEGHCIDKQSMSGGKVGQLEATQSRHETPAVGVDG